MKFVECKLSELGEIVGGATPFTKNESYYGGDIPWLTPKDLANFNGRYINFGERNITEAGYKSTSVKMLPINSVLFSSRAPIGYVAINNKNEVCTNQGFKSVIPNSKTDYMFLYYLLKCNKIKIEAMGSGTTFKEVSGTVMKNIIVNVPETKEDQIKIGKILSKIDDKIELNTHTNDNLLELINNLYKESFSNIEEYKQADEIANITIGKTPPRSNRECFTYNEDDIKWLSISDLGKCGIYAWNTSEKLTEKAVNKYNVKVIPENTIVLSFKLTIGRIAITANKMATNEAIAHFNLLDNDMIYYLYSYLKNFDYSKLGNTSSIATAVNSKIIKAMPIGIPNKNSVLEFNTTVRPLFEKIKLNEEQNMTLRQLRDTLLPKLMNGEIDLDKIEI